MKLFTFFLVFAVNSAAYAQSATALIPTASAEVLKLFAAQTTGSLWKFEIKKDQDEAIASLLYIDAQNNPRKADIDCHLHAHGTAVSAHCEDVADEAVAITAPPALNFSVAEIQQALDSALDIFARKVAAKEQLTGVVLWQSGHEIYASLSYDSAAGAATSNYMCHHHDADHLDCHRVRTLPQF